MTPRPLGLGERAVRDLADELRLEVELAVVELDEVAFGEGRPGRRSAPESDCASPRPTTASIGPLAPTTAQSSSTARSAGSSASSRAATRPCSVTGRSPESNARAPSAPMAPSIVHERRELLDEERVAAAAVQELGHDLGGRVALEVHLDERRGGVGVERVEVERGARCACRAPGSSVLEVGTGGGDEHEGQVAQRGEQPVARARARRRRPSADRRARARAARSRASASRTRARPAALRRARGAGSTPAGSPNRPSRYSSPPTMRSTCESFGSRDVTRDDGRLAPSGRSVARGVVEVDPARVADGFGDRPPDGWRRRRGGTAPVSTVAPRSLVGHRPSSTASRLLPTPASPTAARTGRAARLSAASNMRRSSRQLGVATDERGARLLRSPAREGDDRLGRPRLDRLLAALHDERAERLVADRPGGWPRA